VRLNTTYCTSSEASASAAGARRNLSIDSPRVCNLRCLRSPPTHARAPLLAGPPRHGSSCSSPGMGWMHRDPSRLAHSCALRPARLCLLVVGRRALPRAPAHRSDSHWASRRHVQPARRCAPASRSHDCAGSRGFGPLRRDATPMCLVCLHRSGRWGWVGAGVGRWSSLSRVRVCAGVCGLVSDCPCVWSAPGLPCVSVCVCAGLPPVSFDGTRVLTIRTADCNV